MLGDHIGALARAWRWRSWAGARRDRARPARDVGLREVTRSHPSYACDDQPARIAAGVKTATGDALHRLARSFGAPHIPIWDFKANAGNEELKPLFAIYKDAGDTRSWWARCPVGSQACRR